jgi:hypothetical protein
MSDSGLKGEGAPVTVAEKMDSTESEQAPEFVCVVCARLNAVISVSRWPLRTSATKLIVENHLITGPGEVG